MAKFPLFAALVAGLVASVALSGVETPAEAADGYKSTKHRKAYRKGGPRVRGYVQRRGGYSYDQFDAINTYGDSRGRFGSSSSLRDPQLGRQTEAGPFDHGFFFDSGVGRNGGDAPYMR
jgi:hypothetical protein